MTIGLWVAFRVSLSEGNMLYSSAIILLMFSSLVFAADEQAKSSESKIELVEMECEKGEFWDDFKRGFIGDLTSNCRGKIVSKDDIDKNHLEKYYLKKKSCSISKIKSFLGFPVCSISYASLSLKKNKKLLQLNKEPAQVVKISCNKNGTFWKDFKDGFFGDVYTPCSEKVVKFEDVDYSHKENYAIKKRYCSEVQWDSFVDGLLSRPTCSFEYLPLPDMKEIDPSKIQKMIDSDSLCDTKK